MNNIANKYLTMIFFVLLILGLLSLLFFLHTPKIQLISNFSEIGRLLVGIYLLSILLPIGYVIKKDSNRKELYVDCIVDSSKKANACYRWSENMSQHIYFSGFVI